MAVRGSLVVDALGRLIPVLPEPRRIVSLVPSETLSVVELGREDSLVGCTRFCVAPEGLSKRLVCCGGTKDVDVDTILALAPDLVLANQEENGKRDIERLIQLGIRVHVSFPRTLGDSLQYLESLSILLGLDPGDLSILQEMRFQVDAASRKEHPRRLRVFVPIWRDPWMTFNEDCFANDLLSLSGGENVFARRRRRHPLSADLDTRRHAVNEFEDTSRTKVGITSRDDRYPRLSLEEIAARSPDAILLPDEPYVFEEADTGAFSVADFAAARFGTVALVSGRDLFWYGTHVHAALPRIAALIEDFAGRIAKGASTD